MEESRKQFESEWKKTMEHLAEQPEMQTWKNVCWHFWETSRAVIELDLPKKYYSEAYLGNGCCDDYANNKLDEVYSVVRAAGLRVKEGK